MPARDRLVPTASAAALAARLPAPHVITAQAGHIGMVAGTHAQTALWEPFADWLRGLSIA
jgi:polyhydroxyalkanoate synthase